MLSFTLAFVLHLEHSSHNNIDMTELLDVFDRPLPELSKNWIAQINPMRGSIL
jgi:hypothetical protein